MMSKPVIKTSKHGAGEVAQLVKGLQNNHKDMRSYLQYPPKKLGMVWHSSNPSAGRSEMGRSWSSLASKPGQVVEFSV